MNAKEVIDSYVHDVVRRLPATQRGEVGLELRGLLAEALAEQAGGGEATAAQAVAMLRAFGDPAAVAARYLPASFTIVAPEHTREFARLALLGLALQWGVALLALWRGDYPLAQWWLQGVIAPFWWPGVLVMGSLLTAWWRQRGGAAAAGPQWKPHRVPDAQRLSRPLTVVGMVAAAAGAAFMIALPWLVPQLPHPLHSILAFDATFLAQRAWAAVPLWAADLAVSAVALRAGRWTTQTQSAQAVSAAAWLAVFAWWLLAGPMFAAPATDAGARGALLLVGAMIVLGAAIKWRRAVQACAELPPQGLPSA